MLPDRHVNCTAVVKSISFPPNPINNIKHHRESQGHFELILSFPFPSIPQATHLALKWSVCQGNVIVHKAQPACKNVRYLRRQTEFFLTIVKAKHNRILCRNVNISKVINIWLIKLQTIIYVVWILLSKVRNAELLYKYKVLYKSFRQKIKLRCAYKIIPGLVSWFNFINVQ